jgi:hypothetical protein
MSEEKMTVSRPSSLERVFEVFGREKGLDILAQEYRATAETELEMTKLRWTVYTAFLAVSLTLSSYLWASPSLDVLLKKIGLGAGALVHVIAYYFYWWLHRTALMYREYLKLLEEELGFVRYTIRLDRPRIGPLILRFYWGIVILLLAHIAGVVIYIIFA